MLEDDDSKINEDSETDYIVHPITPEKNLLSYALYFRLISYEHHYTNIIFKYKRLCITWLISGLAGIGFILSKDFEFPFDKFIAIIILSLISIKGIALLWFMDASIYNVSGFAAVKAASSLEEKFNFLPRLHFDVKTLVPDDGNPLFYRSLFYASCTLTLFSIIAICLYTILIDHIEKIHAAIISISFILASIFMTLESIKFVIKKNQLDK